MFTSRIQRQAWIATGLGALLLAVSAPQTHAIIRSGPVVVDANASPCIARYSAHYTTIQAAVNAAAPGSTISVCPGTYPEQISINTSLTLRGVQANNQAAAVIAIPSSGGGPNGGTSTFPVVAQVDITAPNVTLDSLTVDGTGGIPNSDCAAPDLFGVVFEAGSSGHVTRSSIRNQAVANGPGGANGYCGTGILVFSGASGLVTIDYNSIRGFGGTGIDTESPASIKNNFVYQGQTSGNLLEQGTCIFTNSPATVTGNTVHHCAFGIAGGLLSGGATTISYNEIAADGFGVYLWFGSGVTVSYNSISSGRQDPGLTGGSVGVFAAIPSLTIQGNLISGFYYGALGGQSGQTVTGNTFSDAQVGVFGVSGTTGNVVSNNLFIEVSTLVSN
jgi:nitrous oxidase accessory protein NosD